MTCAVLRGTSQRKEDRHAIPIYPSTYFARVLRRYSLVSKAPSEDVRVLATNVV